MHIYFPRVAAPGGENTREQTIVPAYKRSDVRDSRNLLATRRRTELWSVGRKRKVQRRTQKFLHKKNQRQGAKKTRRGKRGRVRKNIGNSPTHRLGNVLIYGNRHRWYSALVNELVRRSKCTSWRALSTFDQTVASIAHTLWHNVLLSAVTLVTRSTWICFRYPYLR